MHTHVDDAAYALPYGDGHASERLTEILTQTL